MAISTYRRNIRAAVRGLWTGAIGGDQFSSVMRTAIDRNLTTAWDEGAAECGVRPDEYTDAEHLALAEAILKEQGFVGEFRSAIEQGSRANGGKLTPLFNRVELWVNRYNDLKNQAKALVCKDAKLEWVLGATEKHCQTCNKLNGKVKRASQWEASGIHPQSPPNENLECGGWACQCTLRVTDKPLSKGPLPRFRGKMMMEVA